MTGADRNRAAYAYLSGVVQGPCAPLNDLVEAVGVEEAARAVRTKDLPAALHKRTEARRHIDNSEADLALVASRGGRLLTPEDDDWPAWRMLAFAASDAARDATAVAPLALWVLGNGSLTELTDRAAAVVGTRAASDYLSLIHI